MSWSGPAIVRSSTRATGRGSTSTRGISPNSRRASAASCTSVPSRGYTAFSPWTIGSAAGSSVATARAALLPGAAADDGGHAAAVDRQLGSRHEARCVGGEEGDQLGDVLGYADAPEGDRLVLALAPLDAQPGDHRRVDHAGMDRVDPDA